MNAMCFGIRLQFSDVNHLSTDTLYKWIQGSKAGVSNEGATSKKLLIMDAREEEEYSVSHLEGSIRMSPSASKEEVLSCLKEHLDTTTTKSQTESGGKMSDVVCYCSIGYRSSILAKRIKEIAFAQDMKSFNVHNLEGSIFKWANEHKFLVDSKGQATKYVHPYNFVFGNLLDKELRKYDVES